MDKYGYTIRKKQAEDQPVSRYHKSDLLLMTAFQLREICRKEKILQGILNPLDKEELIRVILRYRGAEEYFLIRKADETGYQTLETVMGHATLRERTDLHLECRSRIIVYEGLELGFGDGLTLPYTRALAGTNALVIGGDGMVCAILNAVPMGKRTDYLYLTKAADIPCRESGIKNYSLYCMGRRESELLFQFFGGQRERLPESMEVYRIPLLDFEVKKPVLLTMPMAMDFGTSSTTAGVYLDSQYFAHMGLRDGERGFRENDTNYARFYDSASDERGSTLLPSVAAVLSVEGGKPQFLFGYDAIRLAESSYIDEGFCVFYDIKRWIADCEKLEEITDRQGRRGFVARKEILKAFFTYVIDTVRNQFKCCIPKVHVSCPVKQKAQFGRMFAEILPDYAVEKEGMIDEGVSVLYNTISGMTEAGTVEEGQPYHALIIDCGGGTTDLCSCTFRVWDQRVSYRIEIDTAYENGDTDFGGNNLTYRIMQILKLRLVNQLYPDAAEPAEQILSGYDMDVFRYVDRQGTEALYRELEQEYEKAEAFLPTRFKDFENRSRADYYRVKNNFYLLFHLAEKAKKEFYAHAGTLQVVIASEPWEKSAGTWIPADKWKLSIQTERGLETVKEFPRIFLSIYELELLLQGDIYGIMRRFLERMYGEDLLSDFSIIRLTGQSCRIGIFRDALKEYVPGKAIRFRRRNREGSSDPELKMSCVDGALRYLRDRRYGFADVTIRTGEPALPYQVTAHTHSGEEIILIHRLERHGRSGMISRNMDDLLLRLYLKDEDGKERYQYSCQCALSDFCPKEYEEIQEIYGEHILQADTDDIVENEVKFFVWAEPMDWCFVTVPVYRKEKKLYLGKEETFSFEDEGWVQNFFDGTK